MDHMYLGSQSASDVEDKHIALVVEPTAAIMLRTYPLLLSTTSRKIGPVVDGKMKFVYISQEYLNIRNTCTAMPGRHLLTQSNARRT